VRNVGLIKSNTLQTTVAAPLEALQSARNNCDEAKANKNRGAQLKFANEHQDAPLSKLTKHRK
jgi:hypothetical protein